MDPFFKQSEDSWKQLQSLENRRLICGFCGDRVSSDRGYGIHIHRDASGGQRNRGGVYICPNCEGPNFFPPYSNQRPAPPLGRSVSDVPAVLNELYEEARACTTHGSYTAAVLACRKILMHIAVDKNAKEGLSFVKYVDHLADNGYVPPDGKDWVDHIRKRGNEANHEIVVMERTDADDLLTFTEMLLRFIYEFPARVRSDDDSASTEG